MRRDDAAVSLIHRNEIAMPFGLAMTAGGMTVRGYGILFSVRALIYIRTGSVENQK